MVVVVVVQPNASRNVIIAPVAARVLYSKFDTTLQCVARLRAIGFSPDCAELIAGIWEIIVIKFE